MRRLATVRVRVAIATVLVVGIALAFGGGALVRLQERALTRDLETSARLVAKDIAQTAADGPLTNRIRVPGGETMLAQLVDQSGEIVAASTNLEDDPRLSKLVPAGSGAAVTTVRNYPETQHPLR